MTRSQYHLTETAVSHFEKIIRDTAQKWGLLQAETYRDTLLDGFQEIAENHKTIHLLGHHYVAFKNLDDRDVVIMGLFHERMNIPARLKELQRMPIAPNEVS